MRYLRLIVGSLIIISALYILVAEHVTGASSNAFVNAPVVTVRSPVSGNIEISNRPVGAEVSPDLVLLSVNDSRADRVRLDDLMLEHERMVASVTRLETQKAFLTHYSAQLEEQYAAYATERLRELNLQANSTRDLPLFDLSDPDKFDDIDPVVLQEDVVSRAVTPSSLVPFASLITLQRDAAEREIFLDGSAGAAWNYAYWSDAAQADLARVEAELVAAKSDVSSYEDRIERERVRLIGLTGGDVTSPASGVVWERMVGNDVNVQRGDAILRVADCSATVVSLSVSELIYNRLRTGDPAIFRLTGTNDVYQGTVARLAGAGAESVYHDMAVKPSQQHLERYDVTLIVPALRNADVSGGCSIGRTGRVFFEDRPLDPLRRILN